jgi:hypothetical protein
MIAKKLHITTSVLIVLEAFLAVTTVAGGIGLLTGAISPGLELLEGSPFSSYTMPGLSLLVIVGGSALTATVLLLLRHPLDLLASAVTGVMMMGFEIVEVLVIGSDPGIARNLQVFYFSLGFLITILATAMWVTEHGGRFAGARHNTSHM